MSSDRRDFLKRVGRYAMGGGLLAVVGGLLKRSGKDCLREYVCVGCPVLEDCELPEGFATKRILSAAEGQGSRTTGGQEP